MIDHSMEMFSTFNLVLLFLIFTVFIKKLHEASTNGNFKKMLKLGMYIVASFSLPSILKIYSYKVGNGLDIIYIFVTVCEIIILLMINCDCFLDDTKEFESLINSIQKDLKDKKDIL